MSRHIRLISALLLGAWLGGCASGPNIIANSDPAADFSAFQTYDFLQPLSSDRGGTQSIVSSHFITAATSELEARGLQRDTEDPDLLVDFGVSVRETIRVSNQPSTSATMHRGRSRAGTWGGYSASVSTQRVTQSTQGTAAIDVIDRRRNQLVWEAAAQGRVTESVRQNVGLAVEQAVADMFAEFPIQPPEQP